MLKFLQTDFTTSTVWIVCEMLQTHPWLASFLSAHKSLFKSYLKPIPTKNHGKKNTYTSFHSINKLFTNNLDLPKTGSWCPLQKKNNRSISAWDFILSFPQHSQHVNSTSIHQHHIECPRYIPATHWTNVNKQKLQKSISSWKKSPPISVVCVFFYVVFLFVEVSSTMGFCFCSMCGCDLFVSLLTSKLNNRNYIYR